MPPNNTLPSDNPLKASIDWLSFTIKNIKTIEDLYYLLPVFNIDDESISNSFESGRFGYSKIYKINGINIYLQNLDDSKFRKSMGVHVEMTGKACADFEHIMTYYSLKENINYNWKNFLQDCLDINVNFTRLDIAIDDIVNVDDKRNLYLDFNLIQEAINTGRVAGDSRSSKSIKESNLSNGENSGWTIYIGSRSSNFYTRFYNKKAQMIKNNIELDTIKYWQRYELELKKEFAQQTIEKFVAGQDLLKLAIGILKDRIDIKTDESNDTNIARRETVDWWKSFVNKAKNIPLTSNKSESTYHSKRKWLIDCTSRIFYLIYVQEGPEFLNEYLNEGKTKYLKQLGEYT